jgi:nucleotide-binding universal stress UspA family protein
MVKRILVGLGGTPYTESEVRHALELAQIHDAEVTAVTVIDLGAAAASASLIQHRLEITQRAIDAAIASFERQRTNAAVGGRVIREAGDPFAELVNLWRYHDLTVLAVRSLFEYGVVHDPKDMLLQLISRGVRPILAVAREYRPINRVLIAYNGSMESAKAMKQFVQLRLWPRVKLQIACFELAPAKAQALLKDAGDYCRAHGFTPELLAVDGPPDDELINHATAWNADLIVLGSSARARIFKHLLGDVALQLCTHSAIPLFMSQ